MPADWERRGSRPIADCRVFSLRADNCVHPRTGVTSEYFVIDSADWVNVIALTAADEVVVIEQFRHGARRVVLEIPGGSIDGDELPLAGGLRELFEETGYGGGRATVMGSCEPNPAIQSNRCWFVLVEGAERIGPPRPDDGEEIDVRLVPLASIPELIDDGSITHALVIAAFHRFDRLRQAR